VAHNSRTREKVMEEIAGRERVAELASIANPPRSLPNLRPRPPHCSRRARSVTKVEPCFEPRQDFLVDRELQSEFPDASQPALSVQSNETSTY
jgi:hypothetical protein